MFRSPPQSMWDLTIHPLQGPASLLTLVPFSNRCGTPPNPPPSGPSILTGTPPRVYPLRGTTSSLSHRSVSGSDTICNGPSLPLADIVIFRLPLKVFKMRLLRRGFHTLIKGVSFSSSTDVGSHIPKPLNSR